MESHFYDARVGTGVEALTPVSTVPLGVLLPVEASAERVEKCSSRAALVRRCWLRRRP